MTAPLLRMSGIAKRFGATHALRGVSLSLAHGEVLALIGENGAGKSTLMKVLSGAHRPDSGSMELAGAPYAPARPSRARDSGVAMIYQELNLAPELSVEDNIMLGREENVIGWLRRGRQRRRVEQALDLLGHPELSPRAKAGRLAVGAQQLVEIARALVHQAQVIVFDEPTSSLPRRDAVHLFHVIGRLRESGLGIVYISHFLEEVRRVSDRFEVLRDGASVGGGRINEVSDGEIVAMMVGRDVGELFPRVPHHTGEKLLSVRGLCGAAAPREVSFDLHRGEILGVAGLVGAGRTETLRCLFGLDRTTRGEVRVAGWRLGGSPRARMAAGLALVSEDRKGEGLAQGLSVSDNLTLSRLSPYAVCGGLNLAARRRAVRHWMRRLSIKAAHADQRILALSGGNQQKVAIARALHQDADILLLDEPTRGIDVATKIEIYRLIGELAAAGKAIVVVSSYLPELLATSDRLAVFSRGRLRAIRPTAEWTEESVLACAIAAE